MTLQLNLHDFKVWLTENQIIWREGKRTYQELQIWIRHQGLYDWAAVYSIDHRPDYYTAPQKLLKTVQRFQEREV